MPAFSRPATGSHTTAAVGSVLSLQRRPTFEPQPCNRHTVTDQATHLRPFRLPFYY